VDNTEAIPPVEGESVTTTRGASRIDWSNLKQDYERLGSLKAVAAEYGTTRNTVGYHMKALGYGDLRSKNVDWSDLKELYESGMTQTQIAQHYGCSTSLVSGEMARQGLNVRGDTNKGWKWTEVQYEKRQAAVERGAFKGTKSEHFRRLGKKTPKENSPAERLLHQALISAKLSFETQSRELDKYWPDVKLHQKSIIIEVDGWAHKMKERAEYDAMRDAALTKAGFTVIRLTNEQVEKDADDCVSKIMQDHDLKPEENPTVSIREGRSYE